MYKFLENNNLIYSLPFWFRQKHSTSHNFIYLADKIREQLNKGNFACGIFVDFQKAFDIVDCQMFIQKLNYDGIRGIENNWFSSYLQNRTQFISVNSFDSDVTAIWCSDKYYRVKSLAANILKLSPSIRKRYLISQDATAFKKWIKSSHIESSKGLIGALSWLILTKSLQHTVLQEFRSNRSQIIIR